MSSKDYYKILGVEKNASAAEIKKSYRKLALKYHPDRNINDPSAEEKFKEASNAYNILNDSNKRAAYDRYGDSAFDQSSSNNSSGGFGGFGGFSSGDFSDIFEDLFGGSGKRKGGFTNQQDFAGSDLRYDVSITLEDAFKGCKIPINYATLTSCDKCSSTGSEGKSKPIQCHTCNGAGVVRSQQGFFTIERTCPTCHGNGMIINNPCKRCGGEGRYRKEVNITASAPKGVEEGSKIRLIGKGEAGVRGARTGDLYIYIRIKPHKFFKRDGSNIYCEIPIRMSLAILGGQVEIPSLDGMHLKMKIPEGTQTNDKLKLKDKGMYRLNSEVRGDMYVKVLVETPVKLTKRQKEILQEFEAESSGSSPKSESFFTKIKDMWKF